MCIWCECIIDETRGVTYVYVCVCVRAHYWWDSRVFRAPAGGVASRWCRRYAVRVMKPADKFNRNVCTDYVIPMLYALLGPGSSTSALQLIGPSIMHATLFDRIVFNMHVCVCVSVTHWIRNILYTAENWNKTCIGIRTFERFGFSETSDECETSTKCRQIPAIYFLYL